MFETSVDSAGTFNGRTLASWVSQMFVAAIVPFAWVFLTHDEVGIWGIGFFLGLAVHKVFPRAARTGRWVWILPVAMWLMSFISDWKHYPFAHAFSGHFFASGKDGMAIFLVTLPTCSCILYSVVMAMAPAHALRKTGAPAFEPVLAPQGEPSEPIR